MQTYLDSWIIAYDSAKAILLNGTYKLWVKFNFTGLIKEEDNTCKINVSLVHAQIPVSFHTVNYTNNILNIASELDII